jgi:cation diffusion facilitator family transporter
VKTQPDHKESKDTHRLYQQGLRLEYFTVGYNVAEAVAAIVFGRVADSIALVGFGLDSIVESLSGLVLIWRLRKHGTISEEEEERIERRAAVFVAITFLVLAAYVLFESVRKLITHEAAQPSLPGIIIAVASLVVMPLLAIAKQRVGKRIGSKALIADSRETIACAALSLALLIGLGSNQLFRFWPADPIVGLVIVVFLVREGIEGLTESDDD